MALMLSGNANAYLLVALSLSGCIRFTSGNLKGNEKIFTSETTVPVRPVVDLPHGRLLGINMVTRHGRTIFGFKGIPYAQPPVGNLRFKGPVASEPWTGILDASNESKLCPQTKDDILFGTEDCLYLNVYTPLLPACRNSTLLPVIVYIFGGGFMKGSPTSTQWGPYFLLDKDVVLVVPNYRLGVLGFLSTGDEVAPGNYGLKDVVRALEWNRDNIRYFGGDPNQVTLAGGSSGAMSVGFLALSNLTDGLFHKYITQSGTALSPENRRPRKAFADRAFQLGKHLGCSTNTSLALVECLRAVEISHLVKTNSVFHIWQWLPMNIWGPTIEPDIVGALLTDTSKNLFAAGKIRDLPWLSSFVSEEGVLYHANFFNKADLFEEFLDKIDSLLPYLVQYYSSVNNVTAYTAALKSYYLNDMTADETLLLRNFTQLMGDGIFNYPFYSEAETYLLRSKNPLYVCVFNYRGTFSHSYSLTGGALVDWGSVHGDESIYLFQQPNGHYAPPEYRMNEADWRMVDVMVQLWTSFVIDGKPTIPDPNNTVTWEPYSSSRNYLEIGSDSNVSLKVKYNFFEDNFRFWEQLTASTSWK